MPCKDWLRFLHLVLSIPRDTTFAQLLSVLKVLRWPTISWSKTKIVLACEAMCRDIWRKQAISLVVSL